MICDTTLAYGGQGDPTHRYQRHHIYQEFVFMLNSCIIYIVLFRLSFEMIFVLSGSIWTTAALDTLHSQEQACHLNIANSILQQPRLLFFWKNLTLNFLLLRDLFSIQFAYNDAPRQIPFTSDVSEQCIPIKLWLRMELVGCLVSSFVDMLSITRGFVVVDQ
jgi:hypothetical protein